MFYVKPTIQNLVISVTIFLLPQVNGIWPPSYRINLTHEEVFVISDELSSDDTADIYQAEDEMIQDEQLKSFNLEKDSKKYSMLHQLVVRRNDENVKANMGHYNKKPLEKHKETNFDQDEVAPWVGGILDKSGNIKLDTKIVYNLNERLNITSNKDTARGIPTDTNKTKEDEHYDYDSLKNEYESNIKHVKGSNETLNYTEIKEEESFKDAVKTIAGKNKHRNCTVEEKKGIGMAAAQCILLDLTKPDISQKQKTQIFHRIGTIIVIWLFVYLLVAIPCWCQRGWCCCCFQCKFCKPQQRIDVAKKYLLDNPLGVYHTPNNEKLTYKPTNYEKYAQKKLEKALLKL